MLLFLKLLYMALGEFKSSHGLGHWGRVGVVQEQAGLVRWWGGRRLLMGRVLGRPALQREVCAFIKFKSESFPGITFSRRRR
jgi:hypothetical protein